MNPFPVPDPGSPAQHYNARIEACALERARGRRHHLLLGYLRLAWVAGFLLIGWFALVRHTCGWGWLLLPWAAFAVTARFHSRVLAAGARADRAITWCQIGLARIEDRWTGLRPRSTRVDMSGSLYAADLDLFGPASVFELLCSARTSLGEDTLGSWLLEPASPHEVLARQAAIAELRDRTALREALFSAPGPDPLPLDRNDLLSWSEAKRSPLPPMLAWIAPMLVVLTVAAAGWALAVHSWLPVAPALLVEGALTYLLQRRYRPMFAETEQAARRLHLFAELLAILEAESFESPLLQQTQARLLAGARPASAAIRRLALLSGFVEQRSNWMLRVLDAPLLYSIHLALLMQRWLHENGARLSHWLDALGEFEALLSLSAYHFEHPDDPFPHFELEESAFSAEGLGHPLLPFAACVRNDVTLDNAARLLLVSGSNMSGKSTLLRSVGVAAVMAMAGAPVRARQLRLSPMHMAASIQVNDSLQGGRSRFYAEILRLRAICDIARAQPPVLFLLDELLAGTNSRDRLAGATGIVRELLATGAIGLLSTHDLALTGITGPDTQWIRNVHFEDRINGDSLQFDYTLRDGVVTRSNGLELMRLIGLDV